MSWLRVLPVLFAVTVLGCENRSLDPEHDGGTGTVGSGSGGRSGVGGSSSGSVDARPEIPTITETPGPCGNGHLDPGEECDDSNTRPQDGCSPICEIECFESCGACGVAGPCVIPACSNGRLDPGEGCDDGIAGADDGCSETCAIEA